MQVHIPVEALTAPCHIQLQVGFDLSNHVPAYSDSISIYLLGLLTPVPPHMSLIFIFEFCQELLGHLCSPLSAFTLTLVKISSEKCGAQGK